jgi:hypothetical protein
MGFWLHTGDRSSAHGKRVWTRRVPCPNLHATRGNPSRILARRGRRDRLRQRRAIPHAEGDALALKPSSADAGSRACRSALAATAALGAPSLSTHRGAEAPFRSATPAPAGLVEDKRRSESVSVASIICRWCVDQAERGRCLIPSPGLIEPAAGILGVSSPTRRRGTNPPEIIGTTKLSRCKEFGFETIGCRRRHSFENGHKLAVSRAGRALDPRGYCHPTARSVAPANVELPRQADMTHSSNTRC